MKKLLSLILIFVLAFSMPAQAAVKKVAAEECVGENPIDYPKITVGKTRVTVKSKTWNTPGCLIFKAPEAGIYKFTLKKATSSSTTVAISVGSPLNESILSLGRTQYWNGPDSGTLKFEKGDSVYLSLAHLDPATGNYVNGKLTLVIKKVK